MLRGKMSIRREFCRGICLNRVPRFSLSEVRNEKGSHDRSRRSILGRGNNRYKGLEEGVCLAPAKNSKGAAGAR